MGDEVESIDVDLFKVRVGVVRASLPDGVDGVVVVRGKHNESMPDYMLTYSLQLYLLRMEIGNTIILVTRDKVMIASGKECKDKLLPLASEAELLQCNRKTDTNKDSLMALIKQMEGKTIGVAKDDLPFHKGEFFADQFKAMMEDDANKVKVQDVHSAMTQMLQVKDAKEVDQHKKAGTFLSILFQKGVVGELKQAIEDVEDEPMTHEALAAKFGELVFETKGIKGIEDVDHCLTAFDPVVSSGDIDPKSFPGKADTTNFAGAGAISMVVGVRWRGAYSAVVGRTYLVNPTDAQKEAHDALLKVREALFQNLKPGKTFGDAYAAAKEAAGDYKAKLNPVLAQGTGLDWQDTTLKVEEGSTQVAAEGMVLVTRVALSGLETEVPAEGEGEKEKAVYGLQLVDTVVVTKEEGEKPDSHILTHGARSETKKVLLVFEEAVEDDAPMQMQLRASTSAFESSASGKWAAKQAEILEQNRKEYEGMSAEEKKARSKPVDTSVAGKLAKGALRSVVDPKLAVKGNRLEVDQAQEMIYVPINGVMIPFHASCINQTKQISDGTHYTMVLTFKTTVAGFTPYTLYPQLAFLKELSIKCDADQKDAMEVKRAHIRALMLGIKKRDAITSDGDEIVKQDALKPRPGGPHARLENVFIKPQVAKGKGMTKPKGEFEAHENGFRFTSKVLGGKTVDVLYSNVKHMIAAPYTKHHERTVALHLRLNSAIQLPIGTKTKDIHIWAEVRDEGEQIDRDKSEREDAMDEDIQARAIEIMNTQFLRFVKNVQQRITQGTVEVPHKDGYFEGLAGGRLTAIATTPNTVNAVMDVSDFFVLTMKDIEVVIFERVVQGQNNFDAVFIPKDYRAPIQTISNIPKNNLSKLKDSMCNVFKIKYYESPKSTVWKEVLKKIVQGVEEDSWEPWAEGEGWDMMLNLDAESDSDSDESSSEEGGSTYSPSGSSSSEDEWSGESDDNEHSQEDSDSSEESDDEDFSSSSAPKKKKKRARDDSPDKAKKKSRK